MKRILFKPQSVYVEFNLLNEDGSPFIIPDSATDELMKLEFVDNLQEGFGANPAEVVFYFKHPKEINPAALLARQEVVMAIIRDALKREEMQRLQDVADELPTGE